MLPEFSLPKVVPKSWGRELWIKNCQDYCGKLLYFNPGCGFSFHAHLKKKETWMIFSSTFKMEYFNGQTSERMIKWLRPLDCIHLERGILHKLTNEGTEEGLIIEVSTFHDDNDSFRIEKGNLK